MTPSECRRQDSRFQKGFTLIEMGFFIGIVGLLALLTMHIWDTINEQPRYVQVLNEVALIATYMRKHASDFGEVEYKDYSECTGANAGQFKLVGVTLEKGKFVRPVRIEANSSGEFVNPYSNPSKGYEMITDSNSTCAATASYPNTGSATKWNLKIFEIPSDVAAPLENVLARLPSYASSSYASGTGTITVIFDEKAQ